MYVPAGIAPSTNWSQVRVRYRLYELPPIPHRVLTSVLSVVISKSSVLLLEDLVGELEKQGLTSEGARAKVDRIFSDLEVLTAELFRVSELRSMIRLLSCLLVSVGGETVTLKNLANCRVQYNL